MTNILIKHESLYIEDPLYYKHHESCLYQTYNETFDGSFRFHDPVDNDQSMYSYFYKIFFQHFKDFVKNKIVVDAGSGTGRHFPILSAFRPQKILSVEMYKDFIEVQKKFSSCTFPFLKNKKIETDIEIFNETMESFIDKNIEFHTIFFFESWHLMNFDYIFKKVNCDLIFCTHPYTPYDLNDCLSNNGYKLNKKINVPCKNEKDYFFAIAKKS